MTARKRHYQCGGATGIMNDPVLIRTRRPLIGRTASTMDQTETLPVCLCRYFELVYERKTRYHAVAGLYRCCQLVDISMDFVI